MSPAQPCNHQFEGSWLLVFWTFFSIYERSLLSCTWLLDTFGISCFHFLCKGESCTKDCKSMSTLLRFVVVFLRGFFFLNHFQGREGKSPPNYPITASNYFPSRVARGQFASAPHFSQQKRDDVLATVYLLDFRSCLPSSLMKAICTLPVLTPERSGENFHIRTMLSRKRSCTPENQKKHLKVDGWEMILSWWVSAYSQGSCFKCQVKHWPFDTLRYLYPQGDDTYVC